MTRLERQVNKLEPGTFFYVNAINLTEKEIGYLKTAVRSGLAIPTPETFNMFVNTPDVARRVSDGEIIAPQGTYVRGYDMKPDKVLVQRNEDEFVYTNVVELGDEWAVYRKISEFWFLWIENDRELAIDAATMGLTETADLYSDEPRGLAAIRRRKYQ